MNRLADLGVDRLINAAGTFTVLGGSRLAPGVIDAMAEASDAFIDFDVLSARVGQRLADLTRNEAAVVTSGAAAGIAIAIAACVAGTDPDRIAEFPTAATRAEVIVQRSQRNGYDYSARMTGVRLVEIGTPQGSTLADLTEALGDRTACVLVFAGEQFDRGAIPIEQVTGAAHARSVPVVVDAAAGVPPIANLWRFTRDLGANLAAFSGGKGLRGPQTTGFVVGRRDLIAACIANSSPRHTIGRPMKVGKEELLGLLAAVEWSLAQDEPAFLAQLSSRVSTWLQGLSGIAGIRVESGIPVAAAEPIPRALIRLEAADVADRDRVVAEIRSRGVAVGVDGETSIALNPQTVEDSEVETVLEAVRTVLLARADAARAPAPAAGSRLR
jgi:uncharacterized pyridoxal phosphate-dependent enzyme